MTEFIKPILVLFAVSLLVRSLKPSESLALRGVRSDSNNCSAAARECPAPRD